jgi:hypothetical protein
MYVTAYAAQHLRSSNPRTNTYLLHHMAMRISDPTDDIPYVSCEPSRRGSGNLRIWRRRSLIPVPPRFHSLANLGTQMTMPWTSGHEKNLLGRENRLLGFTQRSCGIYRPDKSSICRHFNASRPYSYSTSSLRRCHSVPFPTLTGGKAKAVAAHRFITTSLLLYIIC